MEINLFVLAESKALTKTTRHKENRPSIMSKEHRFLN